MNIDKWTIEKYNFSDEEIKLTLSQFTPQMVKENEYFLRAGEISNYIGYVKKGLLR